MAKEDYNVADRAEFSLTAGDKVAETIQETPDADAAQFAADAGVSHPAYANYVTALDAHTDREDIEGLRERRLREYGDSFAAGEFMRTAPYEADGSPADPPRPGTIHGLAPDAGTSGDSEINEEDPATGDQADTP